jgi:hypothetical protein
MLKIRKWCHREVSEDISRLYLQVQLSVSFAQVTVFCGDFVDLCALILFQGVPQR